MKKAILVLCAIFIATVAFAGDWPYSPIDNYKECSRSDDWVYSECLDTFPQQCRYYCEADFVTVDSSLYTKHTFNSNITIADIDLLELFKRCREFINPYWHLDTADATITILGYEPSEQWKFKQKLMKDIETLIKQMEVK